MAETSVLREFLAVLGFKVDQASYAKFEKGLGEATKRAVAFSAALETMAATVEAVVVKVADNLDEIYWASLRIGASAENIKAYEYAIGQLGGAARGARSALESVAYFIRSNPGGERWIAAMGVRTRDANGQLRDTERIMEDLGRRFAAMPQYMAIRRAQMLGIDYNTLLAMERGAGGRSQEYRDFARGIGVDLNQSAIQANRFMTSVRELRAEFGLLVTKIGSDLISQWGPKLREFLLWVGQHSSEIAQRIGQWVDRLAKLGIAFFDLAMKVVRVIDRLDRATNGWSTTLGLLLVVLWPLVNDLLPLLLTQTGAITLGIVALVGALAFLFEDMKTWTQGGKSLIDWSPWASQVRSLVTDVGKLAEALGGVATQLRQDVGPGFQWAMGVGIKWIDDIAKEITHIANAALALRKGDFTTAASEAGKAITESPLADALRSVARAGDELGANSRNAALKPAGNFSTVQKMFENLGWSPQQAAGIAANLQAESGFKTAAIGDSGLAYGIAQWHPDRQADFARWSGHSIKGSSLAEQVAFFDYELRRGKRQFAGRQLAGQTTAAGAGRVVSLYAEGPRGGEAEAQKRALLAESGFRGSQSIVINHKTDIHIDGAKDPHATGQEVKRAQDETSNWALRNMKGALR